MTVSSMLDSAGRRRSPATLPGFHSGRAPRNKGMLYPADPPTVEEIVCVMRHAGNDPHGFRLRAMIVMLWRGGLRVTEALALSEQDLDPRRGAFDALLADARSTLYGSQNDGFGPPFGPLSPGAPDPAPEPSEQNSSFAGTSEARPARFELATSRSGGERSIH